MIDTDRSSLCSPNHWEQSDPICVFLAVLSAFFIVCICVLFCPDFFFLDDLENQYLPIFFDIGRLLRHGHLPIWTPHTWLSGNYLVEFQYGIFNPFNLLMCVLISYFDSILYASYFIALYYLSLASLGVYFLGRQFSFSPGHSLFISSIFLTTPMLDYINVMWFPGLISITWFCYAVASTIALLKKPSPKWFLITVCMNYLIIVSGWAHSIVAYYVFLLGCIFFVISQNKYTKNKLARKKSYDNPVMATAIPANPSALSTERGSATAFDKADKYSLIMPILLIILLAFISLLLASPAYLEAGFMVIKGYVSRLHELVPPHFGIFNLKEALLFFQPFFYIENSPFSTPVPLGYISCLFLFVLVLSNWRDFNKEKKQLLFFTGGLAVVYLIMTQGPTQLGPMKLPFRYFSYFSIFFIIFSTYCYIHAHKSSLSRTKPLCVILLLSILMSLQEHELKFIYISFLYGYIVFFFASYYLVNRSLNNQLHKKNLVFNIILIFYIFFTVHKSFHQVWTSTSSINKDFFSQKALKTSDFNQWRSFQEGMMLSYTVGDDEAGLNELLINTPPSFRCSQGLLYGFNTINGYSSMHDQQGLVQVIPETGKPCLQTPFNFKNSLTQLLATDPRYHMSLASLLDIRTISIPKYSFLYPSSPVFAQLSKAGYYTAYSGKKTVLMRSEHEPLTHHSTLTASSSPLLNIQSLNKDIGLTERLIVQTKIQKEPIYLAFARHYWPGYRAYLNGMPLEVSSYKDIFVEVKLPSNTKGMLVLKYIPVTWLLAFSFVLLGLVLLIGVLIYLNSKKFKARLPSYISPFSMLLT